MLAPEYTRQERLRIVVTHAAWSLPLLACLHFYLFPAFKEFANTAPCRDYWGLMAPTWYLYLYFVFRWCLLYCLWRCGVVNTQQFYAWHNTPYPAKSL